METALLLSAILLVCVFAGIIISLFQTVTSIRDMSLTIAQADRRRVYGAAVWQLDAANADEIHHRNLQPHPKLWILKEF